MHGEDGGDGVAFSYYLLVDYGNGDSDGFGREGGVSRAVG